MKASQYIWSMRTLAYLLLLPFALYGCGGGDATEDHTIGPFVGRWELVGGLYPPCTIEISPASDLPNTGVFIGFCRYNDTRNNPVEVSGQIDSSGKLTPSKNPGSRSLQGRLKDGSGSGFWDEGFIVFPWTATKL
ncbi:hypothetical protein LJR066_002681 [Acidovorax sp. LjRoot66]